MGDVSGGNYSEVFVYWVIRGNNFKTKLFEGEFKNDFKDVGDSVLLLFVFN